MADTRRVFIVDDHPLFRDALGVALQQLHEIVVETVQAGSLNEALEQLRDDSVDLILLDLNMGDTEGFDGLTRLLSAAADTRIAIVSATEKSSAYSTAQTLGAVGYLPKSLPLGDLTSALRTILGGGEWYPKSAGNDDEVPDAAIKLAQLTPAQRRVLNGLAAGLLNKQIAYEMGISDATVKAHMTAIMRKLGVTNRTQALLTYREAIAS